MAIGKISSVALLLIFLIFSQSSAQETGDVFITWHANNFYPSDFAGKPSPTNGATVSVSAELIQNQKIADVSNADIVWYIDGDFHRSGKGLKNISFKIGKTQGGFYSIRASINLNGKTFQRTTVIPVYSPTVVISVPLENGVARAGQTVKISALPYFFSASSFLDLSFLWKVNGVEYLGERDNTLLLSIGTPKTQNQRNVLIEAFVKNRKNIFESVSSKETIFVID